MHLLEFVFILLDWESLDVQLSLQSCCLILKLLVAPQLQEVRTSFMSALNIYFHNWINHNTKTFICIYQNTKSCMYVYSLQEIISQWMFYIGTRRTLSAFFFFCTLIRGILNRPQYLLSLLARPNCLSLGDAFLQPEQCALVLFLFAAGLFQLLGEGLTPPLQRFNASIQVGALRAFLQQLVFQPEEDNIVATVWKSSRSYNCTVYFYYLKKKKKKSLNNNTNDVLCKVLFHFKIRKL